LQIITFPVAARRARRIAKKAHRKISPAGVETPHCVSVEFVFA